MLKMDCVHVAKKSYMDKFEKGLYRHFKGNEYEVLDVVYHSETCEKMILYRALYGEMNCWVRPYEMFFENIEHEGKIRPRFEKVNEE